MQPTAKVKSEPAPQAASSWSYDSSWSSWDESRPWTWDDDAHLTMFAFHVWLCVSCLARRTHDAMFGCQVDVLVVVSQKEQQVISNRNLNEHMLWRQC